MALQDAYEPTEEQLLSWLQVAYSTNEPKLVREDGKLARMEAFHEEEGAHVRSGPTAIHFKPAKLHQSQSMYGHLGYPLDPSKLSAISDSLPECDCPAILTA